MTDKILKNTGMLPDEVEFVSDLKAIVYTAKAKAYQAADLYNVASNWLVGRRIVEQQGKTRAQYGKHVIEIASLALTEEFEKGYSKTQIINFRKFYLSFRYLPIYQTLSDKLVSKHQTVSDILPAKEQTLPTFSEVEIHQTLSDELDLAQILPANLSWSHYERLMRITDENERDWYMREAALEGWSVRTLDRNIGSQYYYRLLQTPESKKGEVMDEMKKMTADYQKDRHKFMRNPVVAEFLGFSAESVYSETNLETAIIDHLRNLSWSWVKVMLLLLVSSELRPTWASITLTLCFTTISSSVSC